MRGGEVRDGLAGLGLTLEKKKKIGAWTHGERDEAVHDINKTQEWG